MKAILLSGGLDSIALSFWQRPDIAVTIDYGQKPAEAEISAATHVCQSLGILHRVIRADCSSLGSGLLANTPALPESPSPEWWPFRNQLLITLALTSLANTKAHELMLGTVAGDEIHSDGTPAFYEAINGLVQVQEFRPQVTAPANDMTSAELVSLSDTPKEILLWAHSCQVGNVACGLCRGCLKRLAVFQDLGLLS